MRGWGLQGILSTVLGLFKCVGANPQKNARRFQMLDAIKSVLGEDFEKFVELIGQEETKSIKEKPEKVEFVPLGKLDEAN